MNAYWISPAILWFSFVVTLPAMATRHGMFASWVSGFLCACAIFTTLVVATAPYW